MNSPQAGLKGYFLNPFTAIPFFLYVPTSLYLIVHSLIKGQPVLLVSILLFALGLLFWTVVEYVGHRFPLHYKATSEIGKKIMWVVHEKHHHYPHSTNRPLLHPVVIIVGGIVFFMIFKVLIGYPNVKPFFSGLVLGHFSYEIVHHAAHHCNFKNNLFLKLKTHHLLHHYQDQTKNFGFISNIWDVILKTHIKPKNR